jgi:acyl-CoA synthetase (AMP-forming)/AMP-acid ligase II
VRAQARARADRPALSCAGRETSYGELHRRACRVSQALLAARLGLGARIALLDKDSEHSFELAFGIALARGVVLGINWRLAPREIAYILKDGEVRALFVGAEFFAKVEAIEAELPADILIVALRAPHTRWPSLESFLAGQPSRDAEHELGPEDPAVQMYTSGTTGHPKGVVLPGRSFFAVVRSLQAHGDAWIGWSERDVALSCFPSFHIGGFWWAMTALSAGAKLAIVDSFTAWRVLELIASERIDKICMVPSMLQLLLLEPSCASTDTSSLRHVVYGGSPIPLPLLQQAMARFGCEFAQIYGLTETGNTAVCLRPEDHREPGHERLRAAGRPYPGVRAKIIGPAGETLAARGVGEICLHSPANMLEYWRQPEASARTLQGGWVHTGDAGWIDEQGYVYVCDRVKDMIISAGENIYPAEIESVLAGHPAVAEVAVIGIPDERWGEQVKALVVLRAGQRATQRELITWAQPQLADFKLPRSVDFIAELPKTSSGKIKKAELREPHWRGRERRVN